MDKQADTLVILTPAFAAFEGDNWLPSQAAFVLRLNAMFPALKVVIITFRYPKGPNIRYRWHGNDVTAVGDMKSGKLKTVKLWKRAWSELNKIQKTQSVLGIFSFFCGECALVGHYFAKRHRLKHHIWILGQDARANNKQARRIKPSETELVAISDFLVREFERNHGVKPRNVVPIGINPAMFSVEELAREIDLLGAGSLSKLKQYDVFIEVAAAVHRAMPEAKFAISGDGTERRTLEQFSEARGLAHALTFYGECVHGDVLQLMRRSKVLLHTSSYEGFGMVCTEALYAGAHVISFCKPMDVPIAHWHVVANKEEMTAKALELLQAPATSYTSVLPFKMDDTVIRIMQLFGYVSTTGS